ncbi:MAG TPA: Trk system potassium transporter TrkA [Bacteroidales bacterium]|nr:Trk system potassium transporter TrkA [Bacteroidales bacterium]HPR57250.1 Trk system potassium transporter TrkA [Bacteroidales bacterium]HRW96155.1 Trk system potassium transporter TrkA [Bacteroidales bacterium]
MKIIIAGDGEVGFHLAKLLTDEHHDITVVDPHSDLLKMIESNTDLMTIAGDSTCISVLERASVKHTDLLISVVHDENVNLITCIIGKKLGAKKTIARINNTEYLEPAKKELFRSLGVDHLVCPERLAAEEIVSLLEQSAATETFEFSNGKLLLFMIKLDENAQVIGKTLDQIAGEFPYLDFRAVAIHRNGKTIIPRGKDQFLVNDLTYVVTKPDGIKTLLELGGKEQFQINSVMVVGGGRIGRKTCRRLQNTHNIKLIEIDKQRTIELSEELENVLIINGDARDINLLQNEDIDRMDAFIAVTDSSETNILTCLHARKFGVRKTIALVENIDYIDISQNIGIDTVINKKLITASYIARFTMQSEIASNKMLHGIDAEVFEFIVKPNSPVTQKQIRKLNFPQDALIGGITRGNESFIAVGNFKIKEGDRVIVFSLPNVIQKVDRFFR